MSTRRWRSACAAARPRTARSGWWRPRIEWWWAAPGNTRRAAAAASARTGTVPPAGPDARRPLDLIAIDAGRSAGGGQLLRGALSLAAVTGKGFRLDRIRATRLRPGLRPEDLACVRAAALACGAEVHGA